MKSHLNQKISQPLWQKTISVLAYPMSMGSAVTAFLWASTQGYPKWISAYLPVIICAILILPILERKIPYRLDWRPDWADWKNDLIYVFAIQIALPILLSLLVILGLSNITAPYLRSHIWPHDWPIPLQGILMILLVDLMRYWLHRYAHTNPVLWRIHAVHHSPHKLYWLNTSRFHPLEKSLHFSLDTLPFILLGVDEYVIAFYFVCYAVNGFYQHSNIYLRLGLLNYVFSTAELHRWHHSKITKEANHNFSNITIIWDILFGTYYRPIDQQLITTGIVNNNYPLSFGRQLISPFVKNSELRDEYVPSVSEIIQNFILNLGFKIFAQPLWRKFDIASMNVARTQKQVLLDIVRRNQNTRFGIHNNFTNIKTIYDYQRQVPIQTYDSLYPYIEHQEKTRQPGISNDATVYYAKTSGTTGAAKKLPVSLNMLAQLKKQQRLAAYLQYQVCPAAFRGKMLGIFGAAEEERSGDVRVGAISGMMYDMLPPLVRQKFILPSCVFTIENDLTKYLLILRVILAQKNITYIATANPSTIVLLLDLVHKYGGQLLTCIENGGWLSEYPLSTEIMESVKDKLKPNPKRAKELRQIFTAKKQLRICDLWPYLALLSTWTGGNCRIPLQTIHSQLPKRSIVMELGYIASEFRGTVTNKANTSSGLPMLTDCFFEFVERAAWERMQPKFLTLEQLEMNQQYYIFVTTIGGLYRYEMNDIVTVTGHFNSLPQIEFLQKGRGVTNITGEKLYETQVVQAVSNVMSQLMVNILFFVMLADRTTACYEIYFEPRDTNDLDIERMTEMLEQNLYELNIEYKQKRNSSRLNPLRVFRLKPGAAINYRAHLVKCGQREGQLKVQSLAYKDEMAFDFMPQLYTGTM